MSDPFDTPGSGGSITEYLGSLLLITPTEYLPNITTKFTKQGETSDAVDVDFVALDADGGPEEVANTRVFQGPLIRDLKSAAQKNMAHVNGNPATGLPWMVLGRLARGEDKKGYGQDKRPWILSAPSDADKDVARKYIATLKEKRNEDLFA